jgi:chorismate mutase
MDDAQPMSDLAELREILDHIDARLLSNIEERLRCCEQIARYKREFAIPMMAPARIGVVHDRARSFAMDHDIREAFLRDIYDLIITETCRIEDGIIDGSAFSADPSIKGR